MSPSARVTSIDELDRFRQSAVQFVDSAADALISVDIELRRFAQWVQNEHPLVLHRAYMQSMEKVSEARNALNRKRLSKMDDREPDVLEEKEAVQRAIRYQEDLSERIEKTKQWGRRLDQLMMDYAGQARPLANLIEGNPPKMVAFLDRALADLRKYLELAPPSGPRPSAGMSRANADEQQGDSDESDQRGAGEVGERPEETARELGDRRGDLEGQGPHGV